MQVQELVSPLYHLIARGNDRQPIFLAKSDRRAFERFLSDGVERFGQRNHIHLNPERAAIVDRPSAYTWSSYSAYSDVGSPAEVPGTSSAAPFRPVRGCREPSRSLAVPLEQLVSSVIVS